MLFCLQPERCYTIGHHTTGRVGCGWRPVVRVHGWRVRMVRGSWTSVRAGRSRRRDRGSANAKARTHARDHGRRGLANRDRHGCPHVAGGQRARRRVEAVYRAALGMVRMVLAARRMDDAAEWVHRPGEAFAVQGRWHLRRPVVVGTVVVKRLRITKGLGDEAVESGAAEVRFEVLGCHRGVQGVALALAPLCSSVFEPDLKYKSSR